MKPVFFYSITILLYLTIPVIGLGLLGTMVTYEYQVKQARIITEIDKEKMNQADFDSELEEINDLENEVRLTQISLLGFGLIFFLIPTVMLCKRGKIIKTQPNKAQPQA